MNIISAQDLAISASKYEDNDIRRDVPRLLNGSEFDKDPIYFMATQMIERGVGGCQPAPDKSRVFIMDAIPHFLDVLIVRLSDIAERRFAGKSNKQAIMDIFNQSIKTPAFKEVLESAKRWMKIASTNSSKLDYAENEIRGALVVYKMAEKLEIFQKAEGFHHE